MNDLLKNPLLAFAAGLLVLWLLFYFLKVVVNLFWVFVLAFVILFLVNARFRRIVKSLLGRILK